MSDQTIYTAHAVANKGRGGHTETRNHVSFDMDMPKTPDGLSKDGATTPEDLFAAGYAACFGSAADAVSKLAKKPVSNVQVKATVQLIKSAEKGFHLDVDLDATFTGVDQATAEELIQQAHQMCPYSRATRGNIEVRLTAHGAP